jgi:hypothetical protein
MTVSGTTISLNSIYPDAYSNTFPNQESGHSSDKKENKKNQEGRSTILYQ